MKSMHAFVAFVTAAAVARMLAFAVPVAGDDDARRCSLRTVAGRWMFGTGMGTVSFGPFTGQAITALGTMNIDRQGNVSGRFDNNIAGFGAFTGNTYTGTVTVNGDCTGVLQFVTSSGSQRTDSVAVVDRGEMWGMSLDPLNPWTYTVRRISGRGGDD